LINGQENLRMRGRGGNSVFHKRLTQQRGRDRGSVKKRKKQARGGGPRGVEDANPGPGLDPGGRPRIQPKKTSPKFGSKDAGQKPEGGSKGKESEGKKPKGKGKRELIPAGHRVKKKKKRGRERGLGTLPTRKSKKKRRKANLEYGGFLLTNTSIQGALITTLQRSQRKGVVGHKKIGVFEKKTGVQKTITIGQGFQGEQIQGKNEDTGGGATFGINNSGDWEGGIGGARKIEI